MKPAVDLRACRPTADMHPAVDALPYYDADTNSIRCCTGVAEAADGSRHVSVSTDLFVQPGDQCYERVADGFVFIVQWVIRRNGWHDSGRKVVSFDRVDGTWVRS